jgi:hypothetical protein
LAFCLLFLLTLQQDLLPEFEKEGVTDDAVSSLALVDLKALGLPTMARAIEFKSCVAELLSAGQGAVIKKPFHSETSSGAAVDLQQAPPSDAVASAPVFDAVARAAQPLLQSHEEISNIPTEYTDQYADSIFASTPVSLQHLLTLPQPGTFHWSCYGIQLSHQMASRMFHLFCVLTFS